MTYDFETPQANPTDGCSNYVQTFEGNHVI